MSRRVIRSSLSLAWRAHGGSGLGVSGRVGQIAKIVRRFHMNGEFAWASRDVFWMTPIANALSSVSWP